eukprot:m.307729 g.307729  ORF g.307729 m.307729 type:complete len:312 (+) comp42731_c0_seq1:168-1103(+)
MPLEEIFKFMRKLFIRPAAAATAQRRRRRQRLHAAKRTPVEVKRILIEGRKADVHVMKKKLYSQLRKKLRRHRSSGGGDPFFFSNGRLQFDASQYSASIAFRCKKEFHIRSYLKDDERSSQSEDDERSRRSNDTEETVVEEATMEYSLPLGAAPGDHPNVARGLSIHERKEWSLTELGTIESSKPVKKGKPLYISTNADGLLGVRSDGTVYATADDSSDEAKFHIFGTTTDTTVAVSSVRYPGLFMTLDKRNPHIPCVFVDAKSNLTKNFLFCLRGDEDGDILENARFIWQGDDTHLFILQSDKFTIAESD